MNSFVSRFAPLLLVVLATNSWQSLLAQAPAPRRILTADEQRRQEESIAKMQKAVDALERKDPADGLLAKLRARIPRKNGLPLLLAHKSFEGFILDDENLERELWEMIRPNALLARQIIPLRRELMEAIARTRPFDWSKPGKIGEKSEEDFARDRVGEAEGARHRVEQLIGSLAYANDVRTARLFAFLLWESGENRVEDDYSVYCLRHGVLYRFDDLIRNGVLDVETKPRNESEWRAWWLKNQWQWGWSYEIDPITNTDVFPVPTLAPTSPNPATPTPPPPAVSTPPPTHSPKPSTPSASAPAAVPATPSKHSPLLYATIGGAALLLGIVIFLRRKK